MKLSKTLSSVILSSMLLVPAAGVTHGATKEVNQVKPSMQLIDAKGKVEKTFSDKEIKKFMEEAKVSNLQAQAATSKLQAVAGTSKLQAVAAASKTVPYGASSFSNYVNINGGTYYYNPKDITVNPKGFVKRMFVQLVKDDGGSKKYSLANFQGGVHVPLSGLRSGNGRYKIQFKNGHPDTKINLKGGTIYK